MDNEGPLLETLLRRLSECPIEFIETCNTSAGLIELVAILSDHYREFGDLNPLSIDPELLLTLTHRVDSTTQDRSPATDSRTYVKQDRKYWAVLSVATWILHDEWFLARPDLAMPSWQWLVSKTLRQLSEIVSPEHCISDPDRREELVRLCLDAMGLRPKGESLEQSIDRKQTLDSVEREGILRATADAERRAREVREAMAKKQALESASRYGE